MPTWEVIQLKARHLIEEAIRLMRTGLTEAEVLAEATAHATKLHVTLRKNRLEKYKLLHELGEEVAHALEQNTAARSVPVSEAMKARLDSIHRLDEEMARAGEDLARISVVRKGDAPPSEPPSVLPTDSGSSM